MEFIETKYSKKSEGHYSAAVAYGGLIYVSGQLSINPETNEVEVGGVKAEAKRALENLELVLKEVGASKHDVIQCRLYTPDVAYWEDINQVYAEFFKTHKPVRAVVPSNELHSGCLVEIEAIAIDRRK